MTPAHDTPPDAQLPSSVLVFGMGVTGWALYRALSDRGVRVVLADDRDVDVPVALFGAPRPHVVDEASLARLLGDVEAVAPSPGVPSHHAVFRLADQASVTITGDFDVAAALDDRPIAAITGTNGKTTVVVLVTEMLNEAGITAVAAGNTELPLVAAVTQHDEASVFVVEASSFRLERAQRFAPQLAAWLNVAPDHLDHHGSYDAYVAAKAHIFERLAPGGTAVVPFRDDALAAAAAGHRVVTFDAAGSSDDVGSARADATVARGWLTVNGQAITEVGSLRRRRPHDLANASAAALIATELGVASDAIDAVLRRFSGLPHRMEVVRELDGITFINDSKATTPHATVAGLAGVTDAVLIAGGRNKLDDLSELRRLAGSLAAAVAIGEAAPQVCTALADLVEVRAAGSMAAAVNCARALAPAGGCVVLSPACASFDAYASYAERGEHFRSCVDALQVAS